MFFGVFDYKVGFLKFEIIFSREFNIVWSYRKEGFLFICDVIKLGAFIFILELYFVLNYEK